MRKWLCLLLAAVLVFCALPVFTEDAGDQPGDLSEAVTDTETDAAEDAEAVPLEAEDDDDEGDDSDAVPMDVDDAETEKLEVRELRTGDEGEDVRFLQVRLEDLGYYSGEITGTYSKETGEAVRRFQGDYGLEETGIADVMTQILLSSAQYRTLQYGSTGEDVKELQTRLTALGYYKAKISGKFLEATRSAVKKAQANNGLAETGIADPKTQEVLFSYSAVGKNDVEVPTPTPISDLSNFLVNEDENGAPMANEPVPYSKKLKNGSSGKLVKQLQERMAELGYYTGPISGSFQKYTTRAVKKIQEQNGMTANGVVDETTWNLIFNDSRIVMPDATPKPTATPEPVPFAITVDVANQIVSVYGRDENGEYTVVVRQMLCSTGKVGTPSPVGDWVLNGRKATWCYFPTWGDYARYWTRINASVAFHSPIYTAVNNKAMKASSYRKLGSRASHGCIRLTVADAKWIYDNVPAGTVVSIVEHMPADPELKDALKLAPLNTEYMVPYETPVPTPEPVYRSDVKPDLHGGTLKKKSEGEAVYWMQCRLKELGYYTTKCTGKMLDRTVSALKAFQKDHGYMQSGVANQATIDALFEAEIPTPTPEPIPTLSVEDE